MHNIIYLCICIYGCVPTTTCISFCWSTRNDFLRRLWMKWHREETYILLHFTRKNTHKTTLTLWSIFIPWPTILIYSVTSHFNIYLSGLNYLICAHMSGFSVNANYRCKYVKLNIPINKPETNNAINDLPYSTQHGFKTTVPPAYTNSWDVPYIYIYTHRYPWCYDRISVHRVRQCIDRVPLGSHEIPWDSMGS